MIPRESYNAKPVEYRYFYTYERASRHHHYSLACPQ